MCIRDRACPNNLAPTTSTTAQLVMGDALAVCLMELKGFQSDDFAKFHPGGMLGKKLYLRVSDLYADLSLIHICLLREFQYAVLFNIFCEQAFQYHLPYQ